MILQPFSGEMSSSIVQLSQCHKLNSYFSNTVEKDSKSKVFAGTRETAGPRAALVSTLRSLSLHLFSSLARIQEITDDMNAERETQSEEELYVSISSQLQLIGQDMQASQFCLDESLAKLMKLQGVNDTEEKETEFPLKFTLPTCNSAIPVIPLTENVDMASEDQVFEAFIDSNENCNYEESEYFMEGVDRVTEKQREVSKKMLAELKTILIPKAKEWKVREAKALGLEVEIENTQSESDTNDKYETGECKKEEEDNKEMVKDAHFVSFGNQEQSPVIDSSLTNSLSNDLIARVATLAASRARANVNFIKDDECFEYDSD